MKVGDKVFAYRTGPRGGIRQTQFDPAIVLKVDVNGTYGKVKFWNGEIESKRRLYPWKESTYKGFKDRLQRRYNQAHEVIRVTRDFYNDIENPFEV